MKTIFPTATGFSAKYIVGYRKNPVNSNAQLVGTFVLKRFYKIIGNKLVPDNASPEIRIGDEVLKHDFDLDDNNNLPFTFTTFENDLAVFKPKADLVVRGFYTNGDNCDLHVTETDGLAERWFHRDGSFDNLKFEDIEFPDLDATNNMFGWQQRQLNARLQFTTDGSSPAPPAAPVTDNLFFNFYRRDFAESGFPKTQIAKGSLIEINRGGESVIFSLGGEAISAKLFIYDGKSPDKHRYWCCKSITDIRLDTLIISPEEDSVYVLWRGIWDYESYPANFYRMLDVKVEEEP